ncbi:MAG: hypothetical protein ACLQDY_08335 [Streptosporangiaceae bacterium]
MTTMLDERAMRFGPELRDALEYATAVLDTERNANMRTRIARELRGLLGDIDGGPQLPAILIL